MVVEADGNGLIDLGDDFLNGGTMDALGIDASLDRTHAASNVHAYGIGDDDTFGGQHAADGHSQTCMSIGHECHMVVGKGKRSQVNGLLQSRVFYIGDPHFYGDSIPSDDFHNT